jgi:hypothetical protein
VLIFHPLSRGAMYAMATAFIFLKEIVAGVHEKETP